MPEEIKKYKTKYNTEHSNIEDAVEYELVMDVANNICKALSWSTINRTKSEKNGIIRLILEFKPQKRFICEVIYQAINVKKYSLVFEILPVLIKLSIADLSFYLSIIYLVNDNGQCQEALESCKVLLELYPKSLNAWTALGYTLMSLGEYQKALDVYNHTLKITPSTSFTTKSKIWSYIGLTLIYMGDIKKAIDICRKT